jgi:hypothetical protein
MELTLASQWEDNSEEWLIPQLLCDSLTLLSGEPKSGKTALACHLIRSLITKEPILSLIPTQKKITVAWMGFDSRWRREVKERVPELENHLYFATSRVYSAEEDWDSLANLMVEKQINFLVVDHLYGLSDGADLDRQNQAQAVFSPLLKLIETTGAGVLLLTQAGKSSGGRAAHSVALEGIARWLLRLTPSNTKKTLIALGNNAESKVFPIKLTPSKIALTERVEKVHNEKPGTADGGLPARANFILDNAPPEVRGGVKILGKWFSEQNKGVNTPGSGRDAVNNLIKGGLLARDGKRGKIIAGPKLVTALSACVVV